MGGALSFLAMAAAGQALVGAFVLAFIPLVPSSRRRPVTFGLLLSGTALTLLLTVLADLAVLPDFRLPLGIAQSGPVILIAFTVGLGLIAVALKGDA